MDKKLLDSLNNLSMALDQIADALKDKGAQGQSATGDALRSGNFVKQIEAIDAGVKQLQEDNKKILKNQETIIALSKQKTSKVESIEQSGERGKSEKIKDGVKTVLMIATGVLAIGLAFKLVGSVDFVSVLALSISLPLIAIAFQKIAEMKDLTPKQMINLVGVTVGMSTALMLSSWILQAVRPVGLFQLFTAVAIGAAFAILSVNLDKLVKGVEKTETKHLWKLPLVLVAASTAIAASSWILQAVKPVGLFQLFTTIFIAAAFATLSYNLSKLVAAVKDVDPKHVWKLPLVLVAAATAIAASSWILSTIKPIGLFQFFTAMFIAATFVVISYGLSKILKSLGKASIGKIILLPLVLVAISTAIMASSYILAKTQPLSGGLLLNILAQSVVMGVLAFTMGGAMKFLGTMNIGQMLKGSLALLLVSTSLMLASWILSVGKYEVYPSLAWTIGVSAAMLPFAIGLVALGGIAMTGIGFAAMALGGLAILMVAASVVATSHILNEGNYDTFPTVNWSLGVALSMTTFTAGMVALGALILGTFGIGAWILSAGADAMNTIAQTIVDVSHILAGGNYKAGPTKDWSAGISLAIGAFAPVYAYLEKSKIMSIFGGKADTAEDYSNVMVTVAKGIIAVGEYFNQAAIGGTWKNAPTREWAEGVGLAIGAFAPVYKVLSEKSLIDSLFGSGVTPEDMSKAMITISSGIVAVGRYFTTAPDVWKGGPDKRWAEGVATSVGAFAQVFDTMGKYDLDEDDIEDYMPVIVGDNGIAHAIVKIGSIFSKFTFSSKVDGNMMKNISKNIMDYLKLAESIAKSEFDVVQQIPKIEAVSWSIFRIARAYDIMAKSLKNLSSVINTIDIDRINAVKGFTTGVVMLSLMDSTMLESVLDKLEDRSGVFADLLKELNDSDSKGTGKSATTVKTAKSGSGKTGKSNDDLYSVLSSIDQKLSAIQSSSSNLSDYVDEIRTSGGVKIGRNK